MKLQSMTDFVLSVVNADRPCDRGKMLDEIGLYAEFLKQPLKLEMFFSDDKEKVLFEGFECIKECDDYLCLTHENITIYYNIKEQIFILDDNDTVLACIECLCNDFNYTYKYTTLTPNATKQFL